MLKITMTHEQQEKKEGTKTVWETVKTETEIITEKQLKNIEESLTFFRRLGGSETMQKNYTVAGYKPYKLISTSPDKQNRSIRKFKYEYIKSDF